MPSAPRASWSSGSAAWRYDFRPAPVRPGRALPSGAAAICISAGPDRRATREGRHMAEERVDITDDIEEVTEDGADAPQPEVAKIRLKARPSSDGRVRSK